MQRSVRDSLSSFIHFHALHAIRIRRWEGRYTTLFRDERTDETCLGLILLIVNPLRSYLQYVQIDVSFVCEEWVAISAP